MRELTKLVKKIDPQRQFGKKITCFKDKLVKKFEIQ